MSMVDPAIEKAMYAHRDPEHSVATSSTAMRRALATWCEAEAADLLATDEFQSCIKQYFLNRAAALRASERQGDEGGR